MSPKVNLIVRLEFELTYFEAADLHISHYVTRTHPFQFNWHGTMRESQQGKIIGIDVSCQKKKKKKFKALSNWIILS